MGEFEEDPLAYLEKYCDMELFAYLVRDKKYDSYLVNIKSTKGELDAVYDKDGIQKKTSFKLKNVLVPPHIQKQLYRDYKGWTQVKNIHKTWVKDGIVLSEIFRMELRNGDQILQLEIDRTGMNEVTVATN